MAMIGQINHRPGHPGADVRVRQAMAYAIDPATIDQRARGGQGMPGAELFQSWSRWHNDVAPLPPDQAKARELLEAAKADGYDGVVRYVGVQTRTAKPRVSRCNPCCKPSASTCN